MKQCNVCSTWKPLEDYHRRRASSDGRAYTCKECTSTINAEWREQNVERKRTKQRRYYSENSAAHRLYYKRRSNNLLSMTPWVQNEPYKSQIQTLYNQAKEITNKTGVKHHVDHVIPVKHPEICGLHVPWNMQVLSQPDNDSKHNKWDGTYENKDWKGGR